MSRVAIAACVIALCTSCKDGPEPAGAMEPVEVAKPPLASEERHEVGQAGEAEKPASEVAVFSVSDMDADLEKELVGALADEQYVVSARVEGGTLHVTFEPSGVGADAIAEKLSAVAGGVRLEKVAAAGKEDRPAHDCGSCPMRHECGREH